MPFPLFRLPNVVADGVVRDVHRVDDVRNRRSGACWRWVGWPVRVPDPDAAVAPDEHVPAVDGETGHHLAIPGVVEQALQGLRVYSLVQRSQVSRGGPFDGCERFDDSLDG